MNHKLKKAKRLVVKSEDTPGWYRVQGDTDTYDVHFSDTGATCSCRYFALFGKKRECSHILSVRIFLEKKENHDARSLE